MGSDAHTLSRPTLEEEDCPALLPLNASSYFYIVGACCTPIGLQLLTAAAHHSCLVRACRSPLVDMAPAGAVALSQLLYAVARCAGRGASHLKRRKNCSRVDGFTCRLAGTTSKVLGKQG